MPPLSSKPTHTATEPLSLPNEICKFRGVSIAHREIYKRIIGDKLSDGKAAALFNTRAIFSLEPLESSALDSFS